MITLLLAMLFTTPGAWAGCNNLKIKNLDDVNFSSSPTPTVTFRVDRAGSPGCNFFITADNGGASSYSTRRLERSGSSTIPVQLCLDSGCTQVLKQLPEATSSADVITGSFPDGTNNPQQIFVSFYPRLGTTDYQRFGTYRDDFLLRLYEGTISGSYAQEDTDSIRLSYTMAKKIDLSLVTTGFPFDSGSTNKTLNFGTLAQGQQLTFDLVLKFNAGYRIRMSSANNGALKRPSMAGTVPYTLLLSGNEVSLAGSSSTPVTVTSGAGINPTGGLRLPGSVTIGSLGTAAPGTYNDSVTITVATTE